MGKFLAPRQNLLFSLLTMGISAPIDRDGKWHYEKNNSVGSSEHFFPSHWWIQISMSYFFHTPSSFLVYSMSKIMTCCFQKKHTSFLPWHMTCLIYGYFSPSLVDTWRVAPIHYEKIFYLKIYHLQNRFSLEFVSWHVTSKRATVSCCSPSRRYGRARA